MDDKYEHRHDSLANLLPRSLAEVYDYTSYTLEPHFMLPDIKPIFNENPYRAVPTLEISGKKEPKSAGMKIFSSILLNAWRRRRDEVKHLTEKVAYLKKVSMKARSQIQMYNNLFRDEQKRNDELACHLKRSVESISHAKTSCDTLATSVLSLRADKAMMEQEIKLKYKDYEILHAIFAKTKSDLFHSLVQQRVLESNLNEERRNVKHMEEQKNKLIDEICSLRAENSEVEEKFQGELERRNSDLCRANEKIKLLENNLSDLKEKAMKVEQYCKNDALLHSEIELLQKQITQLENSISHTLDNRLRSWWCKLKYCQRMSCQLAHMFTYYLLPATPPPDTILFALQRSSG